MKLVIDFDEDEAVEAQADEIHRIADLVESGCREGSVAGVPWTIAWRIEP